MMKQNLNRRNFLRTTFPGGVGLAITPKFVLRENIFNSQVKVSVGFIGIGKRGQHLLNLISSRKDVIVPAICDISSDAINKGQKILRNNGKDEADAYMKDEYSYRKLLGREDIDGVLIVTPWEWHAPMAVDSMKARKYVGLEVPAAITLDECWEIVNTSEDTGIPCMILENDCYDRASMAVLNMVRQGIFGELNHCQCGYEHDVRGGKIDSRGKITWRGQHSVKRNADLYPTHGIGPISNILNINRGNRFCYLTSTATKSLGINNYIEKKFGFGHPNYKKNFALGDIVTSVIKCYNGETIIINHDTNSPRPHTQMYRVQGTKGIWSDDYTSDSRGLIYIDDISPNELEPSWESFGKYLKQYDHPLWKRYGEEAKGSGHGGIDFLVTNAFIESVKRKISPSIDVYDAASWSVITSLSEKSIALGSMPVQFPDFTGGKWKNNKPVFGLNVEY
jgi:predicted dehydrogenase